MKDKIKKYIEVLEKAGAHYQDLAQENLKYNMHNMYHFYMGMKQATQATINDLRRWLDE